MSTVELTVSVKDEDLPRFASVVESARREGFKVTGAFESLGVFTGEIEESCVPALRRVQGVDQVEPARRYRAI